MTNKLNYFSLKGYPFIERNFTAKYWQWWKNKLNPNTWYRTVKYFCQRGYRGYADCDIWNMDGYLDHVILHMLIQFKATKNSYIGDICSCEKDEYGQCCSEHECDGPAVWDGYLQEMIDGLIAARDLSDEFSFPEYADVEEYRALYDGWAEPLKKKEERGRYLLNKYWTGLWD